MTTLQRAATNRANAQLSTGPKTEAGKQKSSLNALRHGLTGQIIVMPAEDLAAYQRHLASFTDELHPVGVIEANLVQALADCSWRLNRVAALETNLLALGVTGGTDPLQDALSIAASLERQAKALSNLSLHAQCLSRQFEKTENHLRELQNIRKAQEQRNMEQLLDITEMCDKKGEIYTPSENGFVFSEAQINEAILHRNRDRHHDESLQYWETAA